MKYLVLIFAVAVGLIATARDSQAGLGWTLDECIRHYGQPLNGAETIITGRIGCSFQGKDFVEHVLFIDAHVSRVIYVSFTHLDEGTVKIILSSNVPGATWSAPNLDKADGSSRWTGTKDGAKIAYASLHTLPNTMNQLSVWTEEDNVAMKAILKTNAEGM